MQPAFFRFYNWSMPCNVNASELPFPFLESFPRKQQERNIESQRLLDHDDLDERFNNREKQLVGEESDDIQGLALSYTSKATFPVNTSNVDNSISLELERRSDKKNFDADNIQAKVVHTPNNIYSSKESSVSISVKQGNACAAIEDKKFDENDNALQQTSTSMKGKKKKANTDKNVVIFDATSVEGHRGDIINQIHLLVNFIEGDVTKKKPKQLHKQHTEDGGSHGSGKRRSQSSKSKECKSDLKKSNSLGEVSSVKTEDFTLSGGPDDKVVLRLNKSGANERSRDRRSLGDMEAPPIQKQFSNASMEKMENLETADFRVVTKRKNKNKKRRNSISTGRRQTTSTETASRHTQNRAPSPDICTRKYADSVPHSEKSNDSSDADSDYSLIIDTPQHLNIPTSPMAETATNVVPISYADIARNSDKPKDKKSETSSDKVPKEKTPTRTEMEAATTKLKTKTKPPTVVPCLPAVSPGSMVVEKTSPVVTTSGAVSPAGSVKNESKTNAPPDVHNIKNFPAIQPTNNKLHNFVKEQAAAVSVEKTSNNVKVGSNKVQKSASVNNNNNRSKNIVQKISSGTIVQNMTQKDIQTDLSIIQANEKESIQYNAQMLPPDIPDVQTIEKMQFMGRHMQQNYQKQHKQQQNTLPQQHSLQHQQLQQPQQVQQQPQHVSPSPSPLMNSHVIVPQQQQSSPVMQHQQQHVQHQQQQNISNVVDCDNSSDRTSASSLSTTERERPPVVILSGAGNKEVPGLVFGFDVNEKLLNEDMCEDIMSRFVPPQSYTNTSHNHDKIVNFIGSAWEDIANSGNVTYYSDDL